MKTSTLKICVCSLFVVVVLNSLSCVVSEEKSSLRHRRLRRQWRPMCLYARCSKPRRRSSQNKKQIRKVWNNRSFSMIGMLCSLLLKLMVAVLGSNSPYPLDYLTIASGVLTESVFWKPSCFYAIWTVFSRSFLWYEGKGSIYFREKKKIFGNMFNWSVIWHKTLSETKKLRQTNRFRQNLTARLRATVPLIGITKRSESLSSTIRNGIKPWNRVFRVSLSAIKLLMVC